MLHRFYECWFESYVRGHERHQLQLWWDWLRKARFAGATSGERIACTDDQLLEIIGHIVGDSLAYAIGTTPAHGTIDGEAPELIYTADERFIGGDSFTFIVKDDSAESLHADIVSDGQISRARIYKYDQRSAPASTT